MQYVRAGQVNLLSDTCYWHLRGTEGLRERMARISAADMRTIEDALGSNSGYVADFTNPTFQSFFRQDVGIEIYAEDYARSGDSKGKRLRAFLEQTDDATALKALKALVAYLRQTGWTVSGRTDDESARANSALEALIERLAGPRTVLLDAQQSLPWLMKVQSKLREIQHIAFSAYDDANDAHTKSIAEGVKAVLEVHYAALRELLPADFPPSAMGDMARHIRFCELADMRSITGWDVPDVMAKTEKYALDAEVAATEDNPFDVRHLIDDIFLSAVDDTTAANNPDWHMLVLKCCLLLGRRFQDKTGMEDELSSYGRAFNVRTPALLVPPDLTTETNRNWQMGAMYLFQGYRAFLRNTHAHNITDGDQTFALQAVVFLSILSELLANASIVEEIGVA